MSEKVKILKADEFNQLKDGDKTVLIDFYADWCGPCKMLAPVIEQIAEEYDGRAEICKINVDDNQELAMEYSVAAIPTLMIFKKGEAKERISGYRTKAQLAEILDKYL